MTAEPIAHELNLKRVGRLTWRGPCPIHGGSSFELKERSGVPLWTCWSGCDRAAILAELRRRGLWPERERREWTSAERRAYRAQRIEAQGLAERVACWWQARERELDRLKVEALAREDYGALEVAAGLLHRLQKGGTAAVIRQWTEESQTHPRETAALEAEGAADLAECETLAAVVVRLLARAGGVQHGAR